MKEPKTKILFVLEHFHPYTGGVERLFYQLACQLVKQGYSVDVITTRHCRHLPARENLNGIKIRRIRARNRYLFTLIAVPAAVSAASGCHLIQTSTYNAAVPAFLAGFLTRRPVVITVHEVWGDLWLRFPWMNKAAGWFHRFFEVMVLRIPFRKFVAVSEHTAGSLVNSGINPQKINIIMNGLDYEWLEEFKQLHQERSSNHRFVYFGRLGHSKGLDLIIDGGEKFLISHPEAVIELVIPQIPSHLRRKLEILISEKKCSTGFIITDTLPFDKLVKKLYSSTAVIIPSRNEGFCFAAAEAAFFGIPAITSNMGALKETAGGRIVIMDELTPEGLCNAMEMACRGDWKQTAVRHFPIEEQVRQYLDLYQSL